MASNLFEDGRVSEGTRTRGAYKIGETAHADVPEQIKTTDLAPGDQGNSPRVDREIKSRDYSITPVESETSTSGRSVRSNPSVVSAGSLIGDRVRNGSGEQLGSIEQIMIDLSTGHVAYAVLSFGGFLGIGDKLFAVPWESLRFDDGEQEFVLNVNKATLENAPGFDKGEWPDMADPAFGQGIRSHYGQMASGVYPKSTFVHDTTDAGDYIGDNLQSNRSSEYEPSTGYRKAGS